jgi:outer membrane protein OmpA-like peptidoglycan-associated protein
MLARNWVCLGFLVAGAAACEPPVKVTSPAPESSVRLESSAKPVVVASALPSAEVATPARSASETKPTSTPCPPEVPAPEGALAWVSGCKILLGEKIQFDTDKATIKPQSYPLLDAIADVLAANGDLFVEIQGHLGEPQRYAYGRRLTQNRADSVRRYLSEKKGIATDRLIAKGYEDSVPIADWKTEEGRLQNRRVDFVIFKWHGETNRVHGP